MRKALRRISNFVWEIPKNFDPAMNVSARVLASEDILEAVFKDRSLNQLINTAKMPGVFDCVWAMPDIHEGYGAPIGGVIPMDLERGLVSPGAIGYDILCGVRLFITPLLVEDIKSKITTLMDELFKAVPAGVGKGGEFSFGEKDLNQVLHYGAKWAVKKGFLNKEELKNLEYQGSLEGDPSAVPKRAKQRGKNQLGTLGAGNHFLEVQVIDKVFLSGEAQKLGFSKGKIAVMIHSGSRGLGHQVASEYVALFHRLYPKLGIKLSDPELAALPINSSEGKQYLGAMRAAGNFAFVNRTLIAYLVQKVFKKIFKARLKLVYDMGHNVAYEDKIKGRRLLIHRKGAGRAVKDQLVILPGSMGTYSFLLLAKNTKMTFYSVAHGAGRVMSRFKAKKKVWGKDLIKELNKKGILAKAHSLPGLAEEAPIAYKDIKEVTRIMHKSGLAQPLVRLKPLGVIKG